MSLRTILSWVFVGVGLGSAVTPRLARAYTISNPLSAGCHERITTDALRAVRLELATAAPLAITGDETALVNDLQFTPDADMRDLGGATLLIGVRDNDLKGRSSTDLSQLALVHGDPAAQREHCLRNAHEKEPGGSQTAVSDCRAFILERVQEALAGLDATGKPDLANRTSLPLFLALRHEVNAPLPTYYLRIGQAIHALEDSFTHTYRTPDGTQVTVVLDWVDQADGTLVESADGPGHESQLDRCDDPDALRQHRRVLATDGATAVLRTTLDPTQTNDQKMAAMETILDQYLTYSPGCTFDNGWCQAPERADATTTGCGAGPRGGISALVGAVLFGLFARMRRRRRGAVLGMAVLWTVCLVPSPASAQSRVSPASTDTGTRPPITPVPEPGPPDPSQTAFGAYFGASGAVENAALAGTLGARVRVSKNWTFGLDAEWNPWIAFNGMGLTAGAFNAYGTAILRLPLAYEQFNLRITANLGVSVLLLDLFGAPKGSTGIYAGINPLGLEWKVSRICYLIINPLNFALPTPQLKGIPFSYTQYRATIGLELYGS